MNKILPCLRCGSTHHKGCHGRAAAPTVPVEPQSDPIKQLREAAIEMPTDRVSGNWAVAVPLADAETILREVLAREKPVPVEPVAALVKEARGVGGSYPESDLLLRLADALERADLARQQARAEGFREGVEAARLALRPLVDPWHIDIDAAMIKALDGIPERSGGERE